MCAGWSFSKSFTTESKLSELQIENVEAIAEEETNVVPCVPAPTECSYNALLADGRKVTIVLKDAKDGMIL